MWRGYLDLMQPLSHLSHKMVVRAQETQRIEELSWNRKGDGLECVLPFLHLENGRVSLIVHWAPSGPKHKEILEKMVHGLFNTYEIIISTEFSFTPVFVSRRETMSYLIWPKLRDHVKTPINVFVFICTSCTEVNTTSLRKSIFPSKFPSSLIHILGGKKSILSALF